MLMQTGGHGKMRLKWFFYSLVRHSHTRMPKNINSASRLHSLLEQTLSEADNTRVLDVWAKLLGVNESNANRKAALVSERLRWMYRELDLVDKQMRESGYSENLYAGAISNIEHSMSAMLLPGSWNSAKQYLTSDTLLSLAYCSEILPDEESQISVDELGQIQLLVDELCASLSASKLPPRLVALIQHHIELIQRALAEYPITGAKALREAARTGLGELIEVKEIAKDSRDTPEMSKLGAAWKKVNEAADIALKAEKLAQLGQKAWIALENFF